MRRALLLLPFILAACGRSTATRGVAIRDTLPGGVVRVRNPAPSGWQDTLQTALIEIQRIQPADGDPAELGDVMDVVMDPEGRLYVAEQGPTRIVQFDPDGKYLRTVGREGGGPGEYQSAVMAWADGHLVVHDPSARRTSVFDGEGAFVRSWPSTCCMFRTIGSDTLGLTYVPVMELRGPTAGHGNGWVRFRLDSTAVDTLWRRSELTEPKYWSVKTKTMASNYSIPFQPGMTDIPWPGGGLLIGESATYSLTIAPHGTDSALVFGRAWTPAPIPDSTRRKAFDAFVGRHEEFKASAHLEDIPTTAPAFSTIEVDADQRIWVSLNVPGLKEGSLWDLFAPDGTWLGTIHAPFRWGRLAFRHGELAVATVDANDLPIIYRYRVQLPDIANDAPRTVRLGDH